MLDFWGREKNIFFTNLSRDHDRPRRPFTKFQRASKICRKCGARFISRAALQRVCDVCLKDASSSEETHDIEPLKVQHLRLRPKNVQGIA